MGKTQERKLAQVQQSRRSSRDCNNTATLSLSRQMNTVTIQENTRSLNEQEVNSFSGALLQATVPKDCGIVMLEPPATKIHTERYLKSSDGSNDSEPNPTRGQMKRWGYKNIYALGFSFFVIFTSFNGLQNLQSSINSSGGLGLASLAIVYTFFILSGFLSPCILKLFGTKYTLLLGFLCHLVYTLTNYYPSWYTLIPTSVLIGFASGPIWAASGSHMVEIATTIAPVLNKDQGYLIGKFTGIFYFFFQCTQIPGNLASSLILFPYSGDSMSSNQTLNQTGYNNFSEPSCNIDGSEFDRKYLYTLVSVYVLFIVSGLVILFIFVDHLPLENSFFSSKKKFEIYVKEPTFSIIAILKNPKMILLSPMAVFNGLELSFAFGTFSETYISSCFGTYQVGFTLIAMGVTSAMLCMVYGRITKHIPRYTVVLFGGAINVGLLSFLLVWDRVPSYAFIFTFAVGWGVADAAWNTITASLAGILFPDRSDSAYSALRIFMALGFAMGFVMAELLPLTAHLWILLVAVLIAVLCNLIVEFTTQPKHVLCPCIFSRQTKDIDSLNIAESAEKEQETNLESNSQDEMYISDEDNANPMFLAYNGRRPSNWSTVSSDSLEDSCAWVTLGIESDNYQGRPLECRPLSPLHEVEEESEVQVADNLDCETVASL